MPELELSAPSPKQQLFIKDNHKYLAFGGSRGGGKSHAVRLKAIIYAYRYPGIVQMIVRQTYPELQQNHIKPLTDTLRCYDKDPNKRLASYNDSKKELRFPNGSMILFRHCSDERSVARFQGTQTDILYLDEATHIQEDYVQKLNACVRGVNNFPKQNCYTCNPGGVGHGWVKRLFIDRAFNENEDPNEYFFIQSSVFDNKALIATNPDYVKQLEALPPHLRDMWLYGRWDIAEGMFFDDFRTEPDLVAAHEHGCDDDADTLRKDHRWVHVIEPMDMASGERRNWTICRSYDFGYGKPFSCAWWAVDFDGNIYRILELYGCTETPNEGLKWTPDQQFKRIKEIEDTHPWLKGKHIDGVADPAIWDASRGESIAETAARYGVYFTPGDHERVAGWMMCHYYLQFDENGYSRMYVFSNCKAFIRTIPLLLFDEHKPEDVDSDMEDHVADEWRYFAMSRPIKPMRPVVKKSIFFDPLDMYPKKNQPL